MTPRLSVGLFVLSLAALGSWYVARQHGGEDPAATAPPPVHRGYYLENARILGTAADGSLLYEIRAEYAEQQRDERIRFSAVQIEYSPASEVPWSIRADTAIMSPQENQVLLEGNVQATSGQGFSGQETVILTDSLGLDPERYIAETDDRIRLRIGESNLTGTGMLAYLKENRVQIRSNVSGRFVP